MATQIFSPRFAGQPQQQGGYPFGLPNMGATQNYGLGGYFTPHWIGDAQNVGNTTAGANFLGQQPVPQGYGQRPPANNYGFPAMPGWSQQQNQQPLLPPGVTNNNGVLTGGGTPIHPMVMQAMQSQAAGRNNMAGGQQGFGGLQAQVNTMNQQAGQMTPGQMPGGMSGPVPRGFRAYGPRS